MWEIKIGSGCPAAQQQDSCQLHENKRNLTRLIALALYGTTLSKDNQQGNPTAFCKSEFEKSRTFHRLTSFPFFTNVGGGQPRIDEGERERERERKREREREREREKRNESSSTPLISTSQKEEREIFPPPKEFPSCSSRTHLLY